MIGDRGFVMALVLTGRQYPLASDRSLMSRGLGDRMSEEGVVRFRSSTLRSRLDGNASGQQRADTWRKGDSATGGPHGGKEEVWECECELEKPYWVKQCPPKVHVHPEPIV